MPFSQTMPYQTFFDYKKKLVLKYAKDKSIDKFALPWDKSDEKAGYRFLNHNNFLSALREDFNHLESIVKQQRNTENAAIIDEAKYLYVHFANLLLQNEKFYNKPDQIKRYQAEVLSMGGESISPKDASRFNELLNNFSDYIGLPYFSETVFTGLGLLHMYRISCTFSRLVWKQMLINNQTLDLPRGVFNILSFAVLGARGLYHSFLGFIHIFFPNNAEKGISAQERWEIERDKRYGPWVNDFLWSGANGVTNFAPIFHIPNPLAAAMLVGFLLFDIYWLKYQWEMAEKGYKAKKKQYEKELKDNRLPFASRERASMQLKNLELQRYTTNAKFAFCLAAALLIVSSFALTIVFASPIGFIIGYFGCVVSTAMYLTNGDFGNFMGARHKALIEQSPNTKAQAKVLQDKFITSILKNSFMPILIMGVFAVNWPGAILLGVLFIGYEYIAPSNLKDETLMPVIITGLCVFSWQTALLVTASYMLYKINNPKVETKGKLFFSPDKAINTHNQQREPNIGLQHLKAVEAFGN